MSNEETTWKRSYSASLIGNIKQILTGLQGFDAMARELIQNADDAGSRELIFDINHDALSVWNDGEFSSCETHADECPWLTDGHPDTGRMRACDFHAISTVGSGNKYSEHDLTGRFGIGFVSVYQITDSPRIRSRTTELELLPLSGGTEERLVDFVKGSVFELPWAFDGQSPVRVALNFSPLREEDIDTLERDFVEVAEDCLLFLRNLCSIVVRREGQVRAHVTKETLVGEKVRLVQQVSRTREDWLVIHFDAEEAALRLREENDVIKRLDRQTRGQIAFRLTDDGTRVGKLFAYLPTEQDSPIPCHINADFFPEQTRRALVLSGQFHERRWNEMLLGVAAKEIATRLSDIKIVLGPVRLWELMSEAQERSNDPHFGVFWRELQKAAKTTESVWTSSEEWIRPSDCSILPKNTSANGQFALSQLGIENLHQDLLRFHNPLTGVGALPLTGDRFVDGFTNWWETTGRNLEFGGQLAVIEPLWKIVEDLLPDVDEAPNRRYFGVGAGSAHWRKRLAEMHFFLADNEVFRKASSLRSHALGSRSAEIKEFFSKVEFVSRRLLDYPKLHGLVRQLKFDEILEILAELVPDAAAAVDFFGEDRERIKSFYDLVASMAEDDCQFSRVNDVPFLKGNAGYLSPSKAVMPGGFVDPVGKYDTLDLSYFSGRAKDFLKNRLLIPTLTFENYVEEHLEDILESGLTDDEYTRLFDQLVKHPEILENAKLKSELSELKLVRNRQGRLCRVSDCYSRTRELVEILGDDNSLWIDFSRFSTSTQNVVEGYLTKLGMKRRPSLEHALDKIEEVVIDNSPKDGLEEISRLLGFVFRVYQEDSLDEKEDDFEMEVERLRSMEWLPGRVDGQLDEENWYSPTELYQYFRAPGFESQVPVLAVRGDGKNPLNGKFLDFLEMPSEPSTSIVVAHFQHLIDKGREPNDLVYQLLNEGFGRSDGLSEIETLREMPSIFDKKREVFRPASRVFWTSPPLPKYCFQASTWMRRYEGLFDFLGVRNEADASTFVDVVLEISETFADDSEALPGDECMILESCLAQLSIRLRDDRKHVGEQLERLRNVPFLPTRQRSLGFVDEVVIPDSDWLAEPFEGALDSRILGLGPEAHDLLKHFDVRRLASVTHREIEELGDEVTDDEASKLLRERAHLILWLLKDLEGPKRARVEKVLKDTRVVFTDVLVVRSVFNLTGVSIRSVPRVAEVLFDPRTSKLYVHLDLQLDFWIPAFLSIFSTLLAGELQVAASHLAMTASSILEAKDEHLARNRLRQAGFTEISDERDYDFVFEEEDLGDIPKAHLEDVSVIDLEDSKPDAWSASIEDEEDVIEIDMSSSMEKRSGNATDAHIREEHGKTPRRSEAGSDGVSRGSEAKTGSQKLSDEKSEGGNEAVSRRDPRNGTKSTSIRTQYMRSYVMPKGKKGTEDPTSEIGGTKLRDEIDAAAMNAVVEYEKERDFVPDRQPHNNPGYDIVSRPKQDGEHRLIEVKGLENAWTDRGVKLSRTQLTYARQHGDNFWLYVVENARDAKRRRIHAIQNPFEKADEYWFDHGWKDVAEEEGGDQKSRLSVGRMVQVEGFGEGTIVQVKPVNTVIYLTIDFEEFGKKSIIYNATRLEIMEG